jgi:hypothetical protein
VPFARAFAPTLALALALPLAACLAPSALAGQARQPAPGILSDRPGLGDGSWVLAPGVWQAEAGTTIQGVSGDEVGLGSVLLRWGLDPLEVRFYLPDLLLSVPGAGTEVGDVGLGVKVPVTSGEAWAWAVVGGTRLPTGTDAVGAGDPTGFATVVGETSLAPDVGFALNLGWAGRYDDADDGAFALIATPSLALSERTSAYAGYAGFFTVGKPAHFIEAGVAGSLGPDLQWDVNSGANLAANDWFLGVGLSRRWR